MTKRRIATTVPEAISESDLQEYVRQVATAHSWAYYHTHDSRRSPAGFPDCVLIRESRDGQPARLLVAELKRVGEYPTAAQRRWLRAFQAIGAETFVWRPTDLDQINEVLR